jgi:hypothetical protein
MLRKILGSLITVLFLTILISCNQTKDESKSLNSNNFTNGNTSIYMETREPQSKDIQTLKNYIENDEIEIGEISDIIIKQKTLDNKIHWRDNILVLGVDFNGNIITYISFDFNSEGKATSVIKLYTMSTDSLEIIDYLNEDLTKYAFGYPNISGDKMVWCKALVNPDGTYTGYSYIYDLKTKTKSKLITDENIINPRINDNYIFAKGLPNETFYDSEVCVYDINKNQWVYKVNNKYSQYSMERDVYLTNINTIGDYVLWDTGVLRALVLFNESDNKLYNIVPYTDNKQIFSPMLLDGKLLIWFETPWGSRGDTKPTYNCCYLK